MKSSCSTSLSCTALSPSPRPTGAAKSPIALVVSSVVLSLSPPCRAANSSWSESYSMLLLLLLPLLVLMCSEASLLLLALVLILLLMLLSDAAASMSACSLLPLTAPMPTSLPVGSIALLIVPMAALVVALVDELDVSESLCVCVCVCI
jgi:hypothetical protein